VFTRFRETIVLLFEGLAVHHPDARPFGFWTATALVVGGMIGTGIFMMPVSLAPFGWTSILAWIVSIAGVCAIALALAALVLAMPGETGAIAITGRVFGVLPGVLIGWSYWISCWTANASIAVGATSYLAAFFPVLARSAPAGGGMAVLLIWLLTLLNLAGACSAGRFQLLTTILKIVPLALVMVIGLWVMGTGAAAPLPVPPPAGLLAGLGGAVALTLFPLVGFESAAIVAERVRDPARNVVRATIAGTLATGLIYILVCGAMVLLLPPVALGTSSAPFQLFIETYWTRGVGLMIAAFAAISAIGALNCWTLLQGEVPLGMARAGLLPAWFGRVSPRDVPVRVLLLSSAASSILVLSTASRSLAGVFTFSALLTACAVLWLYVAVCLAAILRGVAPVAGLVGLAFSLFAFWGSGIEAAGWSVVLTLTAVPVYLLRPRTASARQAGRDGRAGDIGALEPVRVKWNQCACFRRSTVPSGLAEHLCQESRHRRPAAPVGVGLEAEAPLLVDRHVVRREGMAGVAVADELPVDALLGQLPAQRHLGVRRAEIVVPSVADEELGGDLRIGEGRRVIDAVEGDARLDRPARAGEVQHALAARAEADRAAIVPVHAGQRLEFGQRVQHPAFHHGAVGHEAVQQLPRILHGRRPLALAIIVDHQHLVAERRQRLGLGEVPFLGAPEIGEKQQAGLAARSRVADEHRFERSAGAVMDMDCPRDRHGSVSCRCCGVGHGE